MKLPPGSVAGPLDQDQRWGGRILVKGDLIVPAGITLTLAPGTVLRFSPVPIHHVEERRTWRGRRRPIHDHNKCCVMVFGRFIVEGTPQSPVELGAGSEWGGLHFLGAGVGILKHARVEDSVSEGVALWDRADADMEGLSFQRCWTGVGAYGAGRAGLKDCRMTDMREGGLFCEGGVVDWDGGGWQGGKIGIRLSRGSARLSKLEGRGAGQGIFLESGNLHGDGLTLGNHGGAALSMLAKGSAVISASRFEDGPVGVKTGGARLDLADCELSGLAEIGIELMGGGHRIERVAIRGGESGLVVGDGSAAARELQTECAGTGVVLRRGGEIDWSGGGSSGGEVGVRVEGGALRLRDVVLAGSGQGLRLESGSVEASGLILKGHRDAALSMLAKGTAEISASRFEDGPVGVKTEGARLDLADCEFSGLAEIGVELKGRGHRLERVSIRGGESGLVMVSGRCEARGLETECIGTGIVLRAGAELDWTGGGTAGGEIGVRIAGGALRLRDAVCAGSRQGLRLESGRLHGSGLVLKSHRDAALSVLAEGSVDVEDSLIEATPVGSVTSGARLALNGVRFLNCSSVCCSMEAGAHVIDGCFFDPMCQDLSIASGAEVRRDGDTYLHSGRRHRPTLLFTLWRLVLLTRHLPLLRESYRGIYASAVRLLQAWALRDPRVKSAFVCRGWVTGDCEPGISDLDFMLIAEPLDGRGGSAWLGDFWRSYGRWRRWLPFFGEVLIATPDDLGCYLRWGGARAREIHSQTRVLKGPGLAGTAPAPDRYASLQALHECAHAYTRFTQCGYSPGRVLPEAATRHVSKAVVDLLRYGRAVRDGGNSPVPTRSEFLRGPREPVSRMSADLHAEVLHRFHDTARVYLGAEAARAVDSDGLGYRWILPSAAAAPSQDVVSRHTENVAQLQTCFGDALRGAYWDDLYRSYIVLEDGAVESPALAPALERWLRLSAESPRPGPLSVVVSQSLFTAWRRLPYLECPMSFLDFAGGEADVWRSAGTGLANCRQFRWGPPMPSIPPCDQVVRRLALESAANLRLTWRLMASPANRLSSVYMIHYLFSRTLGLLLERGVGASFFDLDALMNLYRAHFPEDGKGLELPPSAEWLSSPLQAFFSRYEFLDEKIGLLGNP